MSFYSLERLKPVISPCWATYLMVATAAFCNRSRAGKSSIVDYRMEVTDANGLSSLRGYGCPYVSSYADSFNYFTKENIVKALISVSIWY